MHDAISGHFNPHAFAAPNAAFVPNFPSNGNGAFEAVTQHDAFSMNDSLNPLNGTIEEVEPKKPSLSKVDSFVSCTEPGPVWPQDGEPVKSPTTEEFMAILERNSAVLKQATEKNQELSEKLTDDKSASSDEVKFSDDIVDAAKEATTEEQPDAKSDSDETKDEEEPSEPISLLSQAFLAFVCICILGSKLRFYLPCNFLC